MIDLINEEIEKGMPNVFDSPKEAGVVEAIFIRPTMNERKSLQEVQLSPEKGVEGDRWVDLCWVKLKDGSSDPRAQVSLFNARLMRLIAPDKKLWSLAGDNFIVELDLSPLRPGQRLNLGEAVIEVSDQPHTGCKKFASRYGQEVKDYFDSPEGIRHNLRGVYATILQAGQVKIGDSLKKIEL